MPEGNSQNKDRINFHYIKSNYFRVVHADGVHGGITPRGFIQMNFYSERQPIPRKIVNPLEPDGTLGEELRDERLEKDGPVREVEVGTIITEDTARALVDWLEKKLETFEARREQLRTADKDTQ